MGSLRLSYCRQGHIYGITGFSLPGCHVRMCRMHKLAVGIHAPVVGLGVVSACFMCTCASVWFASRLARGDFRCASHDVAASKTWWKIRSSSTCTHRPGSPHTPSFVVLLSFNCRRTLSQYPWRVQCKPCVCSALGVDRTHGCDDARGTAIASPGFGSSVAHSLNSRFSQAWNSVPRHQSAAAVPRGHG